MNSPAKQAGKKKGETVLQKSEPDTIADEMA